MDLNAPPPDDTELPAMVAALIVRAASEDLGDRRAAIEAIYELAYKVGPKVAGAIPTLMGGLLDADPKIGESALWALGYCRPDSIEPLVECLAQPQSFVRERAAHALGNIGDQARAATPALRRLLSDGEQAVRRRAAWAIGLMHDVEQATIAPLVHLVSHGTVEDRRAALHALRNIGQAAGDSALLEPHRSLILAALEDRDNEARRWALDVVASLAMEPQAAADLMASVVRREATGQVREAALDHLKALAPTVDLAIEVTMLTALIDKPGREASLACEILALMRPAPVQAIASLRQALNTDGLVLPAARSLWRIERRAEPLLPALERIFDGDGESVCDLICEIGPAAAPLLPKLVQALAEENWDLQWAAADALGAVASPDPHVMAALLDALAHPSFIVRPAAARALARTGVPAVLALRGLIVNRSNQRAPWAAYALGHMGPAAAEALPDLRRGMRSREEPLSSCCAIAVACIGCDAEAMPYLIGVLQSDDPGAPRREAASALAQLGPAARGAIKSLAALLGDEDFEVHQAAEEALAAIRGNRH